MDQMDVKVSVIMLTHNREELVTHAIESVLAQTMREFEFIIVDNGSWDRSGMIADQYAEKDDRIRVLHIRESTIGAGRNAGLNIARGEYITFLDDDDSLDDDALDFLYRLSTDEDADISICGSTKKVNGVEIPNCVFNEKLVMTPEEGIVTLLKRKKYSAGMPAKLFKRNLFDEIRFATNRRFEDIHTTYKYFAEAKKVVAYGIPKYRILRHDGNNSGFTTNDKLLTPEQLDEYFEAFRERTVYLTEKLPTIADYAQYSEWSYMISMCNKIEKNHLDNCRKQLEFVKKELTEHYEEFYESPYIEEFEREFMRKYIVEKYKG